MANAIIESVLRDILNDCLARKWERNVVKGEGFRSINHYEIHSPREPWASVNLAHFFADDKEPERFTLTWIPHEPISEKDAYFAMRHVHIVIDREWFKRYRKALYSRLEEK